MTIVTGIYDKPTLKSTLMGEYSEYSDKTVLFYSIFFKHNVSILNWKICFPHGTRLVRSTVYTLGQYDLSFGTFDSYLAGLVKIKCKVHVALPKRYTNQFKPVKQSRQQALRAYCPNLYTVVRSM